MAVINYTSNISFIVCQYVVENLSNWYEAYGYLQQELTT